MGARHRDRWHAVATAVLLAVAVALVTQRHFAGKSAVAGPTPLLERTAADSAKG
ncbi:MAG: hypothetical protein ACO1SV_27750 [Fimbriimonas sp.]